MVGFECPSLFRDPIRLPPPQSLLRVTHWLDYRRMGRYSIYSSKLVSYKIIVPHYHVNVTHNIHYTHNGKYYNIIIIHI